MLSRALFSSRLLSLARCLAPVGARHAGTLYKRSALLTQFDRLKEQYKDHILLFQVGDFYELYGHDAGIITAIVLVIISYYRASNG